MPKINGNELRPGFVISHNDGLWTVIKVEHVKPGKGGAFAQTELRNLRNGVKLNERFRSADKVERIRLEQREQQYLYADGNTLFFMDLASFEQVGLPDSFFGESLSLLADGMKVIIEFFGEEALAARLPQKVTRTVIETEPVVSGQTAANSYKPASLDSGHRIMVPPFIASGDDIILNTETLEYVERA